MEGYVEQKLDALERKANIKNLFIDKEEDNEFMVSNQIKKLFEKQNETIEYLNKEKEERN